MHLFSRSGSRLLLLGTGLIIAFVASYSRIAEYVADWRYIVTTDNAYVRADMSSIATRVSGVIDHIYVQNNQSVVAGQTLLKLRDTVYRREVEKQLSAIASIEADVVVIENEIRLQKAAIEQSKAEMHKIEAGIRFAEKEVVRYETLANRNLSEQHALDKSLLEQEQAQADKTVLNAKIAEQGVALDVLKARALQAKARVSAAKAELALAELDIADTEITAPVAGRIGNLTIGPGQYLQVGQTVFNVIPESKYISANFKETQLALLKPGQQAQVRVDAIPDAVFIGKIVSFSPASGAQFSLLPPENASGNFTKITQRIPVRIELSASTEALSQLTAGMSVIVSVDSRQTLAD